MLTQSEEMGIQSSKISTVLMVIARRKALDHVNTEYSFTKSSVGKDFQKNQSFLGRTGELADQVEIFFEK